MRNLSVKYYVIILTACVLQFSCTTQQLPKPQESNSIIDNKYDSEFTVPGLSTELEFISTTVKKIDCLAFYKTYVFPPDNTINESHITQNDIKTFSLGSNVTNESVTGTATTIYYDGKLVGLLTCAHIIDYPDTIVTRFDNGEGPIQFLSVKVKQHNYIRDLPEGEEVKVIATDVVNDLAFLSKDLDEHNIQPSVLNYPIGNSRDLEWGSTVYIMGFPVGNLMVTRAMVSNPNKTGRGKFLTDALYNRGISGSPVLAIKDGVPNFELVGVASSAAAQQIRYLKPEKSNGSALNPVQVYEGDLFVDQKRDIKYGVTFNVSIEKIMDFLKDNQAELSKEGFRIEQMFK